MFELAELGDGESDQKKKASLIQRELPEGVATSVEEAIVNPTKATPYKCLKDAILAVHQQSPEEAWMEINNMTLGDQKPSTLGHAILASIPSRCSNDNSTGCEHKKWLVENIFKSKLPQTVRNGLVGVEFRVLQFFYPPGVDLFPCLGPLVGHRNTFGSFKKFREVCCVQASISPLLPYEFV